MPYSSEQLQRIVQWLTQRVPKLIEQGCPLCNAPASAFGVEQFTIPDLPIPLLAIACHTCGHIMLFNEAMVFPALTTHSLFTNVDDARIPE